MTDSASLSNIFYPPTFLSYFGNSLLVINTYNPPSSDIFLVPEEPLPLNSQHRVLVLCPSFLCPRPPGLAGQVTNSRAGLEPCTLGSEERWPGQLPQRPAPWSRHPHCVVSAPAPASMSGALPASPGPAAQRSLRVTQGWVLWGQGCGHPCAGAGI